MKIAFVLYPEAVISGDSNGIKSQAKTWKNGFKQLGHEVVEVNVWGNYNWKSFDVIHIFGTGLWLYGFVKNIYSKNTNIIISPIIDSTQSKFAYKLSTFLGIPKLRLWSPSFTLKKTLPMFKSVYVRSDYEAGFFTKSMNVPSSKITKIPLSYDEKICNDNNLIISKEKFCLHVSSIYQKRKNVIRLIKAAKKYNFKLVLVGSKGTPEQFKPIQNEIGNSNNIDVLGYVSNEKMIDLFQKAKVFALPSLVEGVGIVALNAGFFGCNIILTNIGGPKEYFKEHCVLVNPLSEDNIGQKIVESLNTESNSANEINKFVSENYNLKNISLLLENSYKNILS